MIEVRLITKLQHGTMGRLRIIKHSHIFGKLKDIRWVDWIGLDSEDSKSIQGRNRAAKSLTTDLD